MTIFRRIGGRIVPIIKKYPTATGAAIVTGAAIGGTKIRQDVAQTFRGKGKKGVGSALGNVAIDFAASSAIIYGAHKFGGASVQKALNSFGKLFKRSI